LLVDIEKLIKQTITRGELAGFVASSVGSAGAGRSEQSGERRPRRDDSAGAPRSPGRPPERERGGERGGERSSERNYGGSGERTFSSGAPAGRSGPYPRREKVDPWFLTPYEPAKKSTPVAADQVSASTKPKQKIAVLLGGSPKQ
jgi:hypothetical protein